MLVLTRKIDQGVFIGDNIFVKVLGVERDRVKIGILAPPEVIILREELKKQAEENKAGGEGSAETEIQAAED